MADRTQIRQSGSVGPTRRCRSISPLCPAAGRDKKGKPKRKKYFLSAIRIYIYKTTEKKLQIVLNFFLVLRISIASSGLKTLNLKWERSLPDRKTLEDFKTQNLLVSSDAQDLDRLLKERVLWAEKLSSISLSLPAGVWLELISLSDKDFRILGKAVSLERNEVSMVRSFIDGLKNNQKFIKDFSLLELSAIQKSMFNDKDTVDFGISGKVK